LNKLGFVDLAIELLDLLVDFYKITIIFKNFMSTMLFLDSEIDDPLHMPGSWISCSHKELELDAISSTTSGIDADLVQFCRWGEDASQTPSVARTQTNQLVCKDVHCGSNLH